MTLSLYPVDGIEVPYRPGQFNMLYSFGVGEVPISISSHHRPGRARASDTIRAVGAVSTALCRAKVGEVIGVRGPFGTGWDIEDAEGADLVLVAGIGLAPLRSALRYALARRRHFGQVVLLVGARSPEEVVFGPELTRLRTRPPMSSSSSTVDRAASGWHHHVGVVTQLVAGVPFDAGSVLALVCGPEVMVRFAARLADRTRSAAQPDPGVARAQHEMRDRWCGHCQFGPEFVCKDGPVRYDQVAPLLAVRER